MYVRKCVVLMYNDTPVHSLGCTLPRLNGTVPYSSLVLYTHQIVHHLAKDRFFAQYIKADGHNNKKSGFSRALSNVLSRLSQYQITSTRVPT